MKPIEIGTTSAGLPSASVGNTRIHSKYDPQKEAERFLDSQELPGDFRGKIVLAGAGLGYLDAALRRRFPECRIIAFHLAEELYRSRIDPLKDPGKTVRWHPGTGTDIESFLHQNLAEYEVPGLKILEWPASISAMPEQADLVRNALAAVVRLHSGNISATAAFGRHWIRNLLRNYVDLDQSAVPAGEHGPVVIAASGPSLEEALPLLSRNRNRYSLWSLPSSVPALAGAGLVPDLIFSSDAGFWARLHTRFFPAEVPVAMPLSAVPANGNPILAIRQQTPGEEVLLGGKAGLHLPETATVAATAVEAWNRLSRGPLLLAGLDLAWTDLQSHARPHGFDGWLAAAESRTAPPLSMALERAAVQAPYREGNRRWGPSLQTYADWFGRIGGNRAITRFRTAESIKAVSPVAGLAEAGPEWFDNLSGGRRTGDFRITETGEDRRNRRKKVSRLLAEWTRLNTSETEGEKAARLRYMLDPSGVLDAGRLSGDGKRARMDRHRDEVTDILRGLSRSYE